MVLRRLDNMIHESRKIALATGVVAIGLLAYCAGEKVYKIMSSQAAEEERSRLEQAIEKNETGPAPYNIHEPKQEYDSS